MPLNWASSDSFFICKPAKDSLGDSLYSLGKAFKNEVFEIAKDRTKDHGWGEKPTPLPPNEEGQQSHYESAYEGLGPRGITRDNL